MFRPTSVCVMLAMVALQATIARAVLQEESPELSRREEGDLIRELVERLQESKRDSDGIPDNFCADVSFCSSGTCYFVLPGEHYGLASYKKGYFIVQLDDKDEKRLFDFKRSFIYWPNKFLLASAGLFKVLTPLVVPEPFTFKGKEALVQIHSAKMIDDNFNAEKFCVVEAQCFPKTSCERRSCHFRPQNKASVDVAFHGKNIRVTVEDEKKTTVMSYTDDIVDFSRQFAWAKTAMTVQKPFQLLGRSYKAVHFIRLRASFSINVEKMCLEPDVQKA